MNSPKENPIVNTIPTSLAMLYSFCSSINATHFLIHIKTVKVSPLSKIDPEFPAVRLKKTFSRTAESPTFDRDSSLKKDARESARSPLPDKRNLGSLDLLLATSMPGWIG
jgi:hypothetical protein